MQQIPASVNTFGDISDYVTEQDNKQSIKSFEREKRAIT